MHMLTLFSDLDRTLVYSHRVKPETPCVAAELLDGRIQSYITERTLHSLSGMTDRGELTIVPVTTRTKEQYERLGGVMERLSVRAALICSGAVLLADGKVDEQWLKESSRLAERELPELEKANKLLEKLCGKEKTRFPYELMASAVYENPQACIQALKRSIDEEKCFIGSDGKKIYCIPRSMSKGNALQRFRRRFPSGACVAAGDSVFDVSMLNEADFAVFPEALSADICSSQRRHACREAVLSDRLCEILESLLRDPPQKV